MYAVIEQGSKQYKVAEGDNLNIELTDVAPDAKTIELDKVLFVSDGKEVKIGTPLLDGHKVVAEVRNHGRGKKIHIMKFRRRKNSMKRQGHRQNYTEVEIKEIA